MTVPQETEPYEAPGFEKLTFIPEAGQESRSSGVRPSFLGFHRLITRFVIMLIVEYDNPTKFPTALNRKWGQPLNRANSIVSVLQSFP
jgi:hypothetical protein